MKRKKHNCLTCKYFVKKPPYIPHYAIGFCSLTKRLLKYPIRCRYYTPVEVESNIGGGGKITEYMGEKG